MRTIILSLALLTGCAMRPNVVATPATKAEAVSLYLNGASIDAISEHYNIKHDEARELLRLTVRDLYRMLDRDRRRPW